MLPGLRLRSEGLPATHAVALPPRPHAPPRPAEVLFVAANEVVVGRAALTPSQILWLNLLTDGLSAMALAFTPAAPDVMRRAPRRLDAPLLATADWAVCALVGTALASAALAVQAAYPAAHSRGGGLRALCGAHAHLEPEPGGGDDGVGDACAARGQTAALTALIVGELAQAMATGRVAHRAGVNAAVAVAVAVSIAAHAVALYVPALASALGLAPLTAGDWAVAIAAAIPALVVTVTTAAVRPSQSGRCVPPPAWAP